MDINTIIADIINYKQVRIMYNKLETLDGVYDTSSQIAQDNV